MPNWTENFMDIHGTTPEIQRFISAITRTTENNITEYRICELIPMPEALVGTTSPTPDSPEPNPNWAKLLSDGEVTQEWHDELVANQVSRYEAGQRAKAETGYANWYDWQVANYGVKWGDSDTTILEFTPSDNPNEIVGLSLTYYTPWSTFSESFFARISEMFPTLRFEVSYEEESGDFVGVTIAHGGRVADKAVDFHKLVEAELGSPPDAYDEEAYLDFYDNRTDLSSRVRDEISESLAKGFPYPV